MITFQGRKLENKSGEWEKREWINKSMKWKNGLYNDQRRQCALNWTIWWTQPSAPGNERYDKGWGKMGVEITSNSSIVVFSSWTFKSFCVSSSPGSWPPTSSLRYCWSILSKAAFRSFLNPWERWKIIPSVKCHWCFTFDFSLLMSTIHLGLPVKMAQ